MSKNLISQNEISSFMPALGNDIIYLDGEETSKIERMIKEKYVEAHHSRDISFLENKNYWRTYTGTPRKEVTRRNREDLIDYLYKYYKARENETSSLQEVFNRSQGYRLNILNRSENTVERDRQVFERFYDKNFRMKPIGWFNDEYISRYINKRSKELNPKERALKDSLLILNRIFEYALKQEKIISYNPVQCVDIRNYYKNCDSTVKSSDKKIFTIEEIEAIKARIKAEMSGKQYDIIGYAMLFSIETGVRVAEIPPLRWSDITDKGITYMLSSA